MRHLSLIYCCDRDGRRLSSTSLRSFRFLHDWRSRAQRQTSCCLFHPSSCAFQTMSLNGARAWKLQPQRQIEGRPWNWWHRLQRVHAFSKPSQPSTRSRVLWRVAAQRQRSNAQAMMPHCECRETLRASEMGSVQAVHHVAWRFHASGSRHPQCASLWTGVCPAPKWGSCTQQGTALNLRVTVVRSSLYFEPLGSKVVHPACSWQGRELHLSCGLRLVNRLTPKVCC